MIIIEEIKLKNLKTKNYKKRKWTVNTPLHSTMNLVEEQLEDITQQVIGDLKDLDELSQKRLIEVRDDLENQMASLEIDPEKIEGIVKEMEIDENGNTISEKFGKLTIESDKIESIVSNQQFIDGQVRENTSSITLMDSSIKNTVAETFEDEDGFVQQRISEVLQEVDKISSTVQRYDQEFSDFDDKITATNTYVDQKADSWGVSLNETVYDMNQISGVDKWKVTEYKTNILEDIYPELDDLSKSTEILNSYEVDDSEIILSSNSSVGVLTKLSTNVFVKVQETINFTVTFSNNKYTIYVNDEKKSFGGEDHKEHRITFRQGWNSFDIFVFNYFPVPLIAVKEKLSSLEEVYKMASEARQSTTNTITSINLDKSGIRLKGKKITLDGDTEINGSFQVGDVNVTEGNTVSSMFQVQDDRITAEINSVNETIEGHRKETNTALEILDGKITAGTGDITTDIEDYKKATNAKLEILSDRITTEVSDVQGNLDDALKEVNSSIEQTADRLNLSINNVETDMKGLTGVDMWECKTYSKTLESYTSIPTLKDINGMEYENIDILDDDVEFECVGPKIMHLYTNVYSLINKSVTWNQIVNDSSTAVYLDNKLTHSSPDSNVPIRLSLKKGWNNIEVLLYVHAGNGEISFEDKLSSLVDKMAYGVKNPVSEVLTEINLDPSGVRIKGEKITLTGETEVEGSFKVRDEMIVEGGLSVDSIKAIGDKITTTVEGMVSDEEGNLLGESISRIEQKADRITMVVEGPDQGSVTNRLGKLELTDEEFSVKVSETNTIKNIQSHLDSLGQIGDGDGDESLVGMVVRHESSIQAMPNTIKLRVSELVGTEEDDNALYERFSNIDLEVGRINQSVTTTINDLNTVKTSTIPGLSKTLSDKIDALEDKTNIELSKKAGIEILDDSITNRVEAMLKETDGEGNELSKFYSEFTQIKNTTNEIDLAVGVLESESTGEKILTRLNMTPDGMRLEGKKITLDGKTQINGDFSVTGKTITLTGDTNINGTFKVGSTAIADNAITTGKIAADAITSKHIMAGSVTASEISLGAVDGTKISDGAISTKHISVSGIDAGTIKSGFISADRIKSGSITSDHIEAGSLVVGGSNGQVVIADGSITANKLNVGDNFTVENGKLKVVKIEADSIKTGSLIVGEGSNEVNLGGVVNANNLTIKNLNVGLIGGLSGELDNIKNSVSASLVSTLGKMLYLDPTFEKGANSIVKYDNNATGSIVHEIVTGQSMDNLPAPNNSNKILRISKSQGSVTSPAMGGFTFLTPSRARARFITKLTAWIPTGHRIVWASNAVGTGGKHKWLTSVEGKSAWTEYICEVVCGDSGTFATTNFYYLSSDDGNQTKAVTWALCYATVFDVNSNEQGWVSDSYAILNDLTADNRLTPLEKQEAKREWDTIWGEYSNYVTQANSYGVSTTDYTKKYNDLNTYITPLLTNLGTTSDIDGSTFRAHFINYYNSRRVLLNEITNVTKQLANSASEHAQQAKDHANVVNKKVDDYASDGTLTPAEKSELKREVDTIEQEINLITNRATQYGVSHFDIWTAWTGLANWRNNIFTAAGAFVGDLAPMRNFFKMYYLSREKIFDGIALKAKQLADNAQNAADNAQNSANAAQNTANALSTTIGNMKVCGDNLVMNSGNFLATTNWTSNGGGISIENKDGYSCLKTTMPSGIAAVNSNLQILLDGGTEYIVCATMKASSNIQSAISTPLHYWIGTAPNTNSGGTAGTMTVIKTPVINNSTWETIILKLTTTGTKGDKRYLRLFIYRGTGTETVWLRDIFVGAGNTYNGWTPSALEGKLDAKAIQDKIDAGWVVLNANTAVNGVLQIGAANINSGIITGTHIANGTITTANIATNAITADKINAGSITTAHLSASGISADKIQTGTLDAEKVIISKLKVGSIVGFTEAINAVDGLTDQKLQLGELNITANTKFVGDVTFSSESAEENQSISIGAGKISFKRDSKTISTINYFQKGELTTDKNGVEISFPDLKPGKVSLMVLPKELDAGQAFTKMHCYADLIDSQTNTFKTYMYASGSSASRNYYTSSKSASVTSSGSVSATTYRGWQKSYTTSFSRTTAYIGIKSHNVNINSGSLSFTLTFNRPTMPSGGSEWYNVKDPLVISPGMDLFCTATTTITHENGTRSFSSQVGRTTVTSYSARYFNLAGQSNTTGYKCDVCSKVELTITVSAKNLNFTRTFSDSYYDSAYTAKSITTSYKIHLDGNSSSTGAYWAPEPYVIWYYKKSSSPMYYYNIETSKQSISNNVKAALTNTTGTVSAVYEYCDTVKDNAFGSGRVVYEAREDI